MQIGLRENNMARHEKAGRETDRKGDEPGAYFGSDIETAVNMSYLVVQYKIDGDVFNKYVQHRIRPSTREVAKSLGRNPTGEWPVKEIYNPYYDMSE